MQVHVVSPAFCEEEVIIPFIEEVSKVARAHPEFGEWSLTIVDDGSVDRTLDAAASRLLESGNRPLRLRIVALSRNFGHQAAIQAGLEVAFRNSREGDFFVVLDSDLQHPPELIPQILERLSQGADHVQMIRTDTNQTPFLKRMTSSCFYAVFRWMTGLDLKAGSADFRGMSRRFLAAYLTLTERGRFNRGLFQWLGFPTVHVPYVPRDRAAGQSKYTLRRMIKLAATGLLQFSARPLLLLCTAVLALSFSFCLAYAVYILVQIYQGKPLVPGWLSVMFMITFWSGTLALIQFLIALYIDRIFDEVKSRPVYVIREILEGPLMRDTGAGDSPQSNGR
jgi:dolichol-phosphate mannosyltransferase